ncbi:MAG: hypothetical protein AAGE89_14950, partial [Pseudomonadota bacterium]
MNTRVKPFEGKVVAMVHQFLTSKKFEFFITGLIIFNAITLGIETSKTAVENFGDILFAIDRFVLFIFVVEIIA